MFTDTLPQKYSPYEELILCNNVLRNVPVPITVNNFPILLIGKDQMIWLAAPLNKEASQWRFIVEGHTSNHPEIVINHSSDQKSVTISHGSIQLLGAKEESLNKAIVYQLDLRPIGLSIYGDNTVLNVSDARLANNSFIDIPIMIAVGG